VSWRIFATDASQLDFEALSEVEQASLADDLFGWVDNGPPRTKRRDIAGVELFEDEVPSGPSEIRKSRASRLDKQAAQKCVPALLRCPIPALDRGHAV